MYYKQKPKTYPGRGVVRAVQAVLMVAVVMIAGTALLERFAPEPAYEPFTRGEVVLNIAPEAELLSLEDYWNTALDYHTRNDYFTAIDYYSRGIAMDDSFPFFYLNRGVAYEQTNQRYESMQDLWTYIQRNTRMSMTHQEFTPGVSETIEMSFGRTYHFPFHAEYGSDVTVSVQAVGGDVVDPVIVLLDGYNNPIASNDDILVNGNLLSMDSFLSDVELPYNCGSAYTLVVHHAGGGSEGTLNVSMDIR
jgi:tetratricopeptide (TPR) repeat protein